MDLEHLTTPTAVFVAGMVTSLHCSVMCGPLACAILPKKNALPAIGSYHLSRAVAYVIIGGILGAVGKSAASVFSSSPAQFLPWVLIALFVAFGLGLEKKLPTPRIFAKLLPKLRFGGSGGVRGAALLGLATPFLPCAPLYLVFGVALFAGSFLRGALLMACFAAGTLPLYALVQSQYARLQTRLSPIALQRSRQGLAWVSAILLAWRVSTGAGAGLSNIHCPFCL